MYSPRDLLTVGLATALGIGLLVKPGVAVRIYAALYGGASGHRGRWGEDPDFDRWETLAARGVGVLALLAAGAILALPHL